MSGKKLSGGPRRFGDQPRDLEAGCSGSRSSNGTRCPPARSGPRWWRGHIACAASLRFKPHRAPDVSHYTKSFYYGRYDIKCSSIEDLKRGKNFSIVEYNGCGAEPHHIYGDGNTFLQGCKILVHHWNVLFKISRYNHQHGVPYWKHSAGAAFTKNARKHFKKLKELDAVFEFENETAPVALKMFPSSLPGILWVANPWRSPAYARQVGIRQASPAFGDLRRAGKKNVA